MRSNIPGMKTVTLEELHEQTGRVVREAATEEIVVTENGRPLAVLRGVQNESGQRQYWQERERKLAALPRLTTNSTPLISEDRDRG